MRFRVDVMELQVMLIMTVRRHASESLIAMDMRANDFPLSSRDRLRRSLQRLAEQGVLVHHRPTRLWALVSYEAASSWCSGARESFAAQEAALKQTEAQVKQMSIAMEQLQDHVAGKGAWHSTWIKKAKQK